MKSVSLLEIGLYQVQLGSESGGTSPSIFALTPIFFSGVQNGERMGKFRRSGGRSKLIGRKTVLVVGAGAVVPYGLPTGRELAFGISEGLKIKPGTNAKANHGFFDLVCSCGFDANSVAAFGLELWQSGQPSVDAFLERRPQFLEVGKCAIAAKLLSFEEPDRFSRKEQIEDRWYEYLFQKLSEGAPTVDVFRENELSIVTFNYDRSLEFSLASFLSVSYGVSLREAASVMEDVPVYHVYGSLGDFLDERPFKPTSEVKDIVRAGGGIQIYSQDWGEEERKNLEDVQVKISGAECIGFMGFGYLPVNVERIGAQLSNSMNERVIFGMGFGLGGAEVATVERLLAPDGTAPYGMRRVNISDNNVGCLKFLKETPILHDVPFDLG